MAIFETTKKCINQEIELDELKALSERIDVMYLVGGKFSDDEYIELVELVSSKIEDLESTISGENVSESYKEKMASEKQ